MNNTTTTAAATNKIIIYSTESCKYCHIAKEYLTEKGFTFESKDVGKDAEARKESVSKSGQLGVPVIDINNNIVVGFDQAIIDQLLGIQPAAAQN